MAVRRQQITVLRAQRRYAGYLRVGLGGLVTTPRWTAPVRQTTVTKPVSVQRLAQWGRAALV